MTERWPKVLSVILVVILVPMTIIYVYKGIEVNTLRAAQTETLQTIQRQTQLVVDLRKTLAKEQFRNFESEQELRSWVTNWMLTKMPIVIEAFGASLELRGQKYSEYMDCDDFAEAMQRDAFREGYIMDKVLIGKDGMIYEVKVTDLVNHAGNMAMTDNTYWYIEPQLGQIVRITSRD